MTDGTAARGQEKSPTGRTRNDMTIPLPPPGANAADDHMAISRGFVDHARNELRLANNLQASEKVWDAAAHAIKAIAIERGWRHEKHGYLFDIVSHIAKECDRPDFSDKMSIAGFYHKNFYENEFGENDIRRAINTIEQFVTELDDVRCSPPRPFTVTTNEDRRHLQNLLGRAVDIGERSDVGFAQPPTHD